MHGPYCRGIPYGVCGLVALWLRRWTCDWEVAGSTPGLVLSGNNLGQVVHIPASVTNWYKLVLAEEWRKPVAGAWQVCPCIHQHH